MSRVKPAIVRLYFDADVLGLAKLLCQARPDCTYPGDHGAVIQKRRRPACIIKSPGELDPVWIPKVAAEGWLIVTRDRHIQDRVSELSAVREYGAKMLNFSSDDAASTWGQLEVFMARWREIEALIDQPGPFLFRVSRTGAFRPVDIQK